MNQNFTSFFHEKLANGLEVAAESLPFAQSLSIGFFVRCGSRNETPEISGISHFLEHMIFKGSASRSAQDVNREFDALGISFNACTMEESTVFYATLLPEFLEPCLQIYADILRPVLREEDFNAEKEVILEEIGMYENEPPYCMDDRLRQVFFNGHPLGNPVLGTTESVRGLTRSQLKSWIQEKYAPENVLLCACGRVDFDLFVRLAEKFCGNWKNVSRPALPQNVVCSHSEARSSNAEVSSSRITGIPRKKSCLQPGSSLALPAVITPQLGFQRFQQPQAAQQYLLACSASSAATFRERLAGRLIASILGDDAGSRLYWEFVDSGLAEHAVLGFTEFTDAGFFSSSLACEPEEAEKNRDRLEKIYRSAETGNISEEELALAKNRIATACVLGGEKAWGRIFGVGGEWAASREYRSSLEEVELLRSITLSEVGSLLERFPLTQSLTFSVGP